MDSGIFTDPPDKAGSLKNDVFPPKKQSIRDSNALHQAVSTGNVETVRILASHLPNLDGTDSEGNTALHVAAGKGNTNITKLLLAAGADPRVTNTAGDTVIHYAVQCGHAHVLQVLLTYSAIDVNSPGFNGETPLHVAAAYNQVECAKILVEHNADVTRRNNSGAMPIHLAASVGSTDVLRFILQGPDAASENLLAAVDFEEATPLHLATNRGDPATVKMLLERRASISPQMFDQSTPLHIACALGVWEIVEMMWNSDAAEFGKVMDKVDAQGMTPLHRAAMFNHWKLLRMLIEKHAKLNARDTNGRTVLVLAASRGAWDAVSELLTCGADPLVTSYDGQNFLHYVVQLGGDVESFKDDVQNSGEFATILTGKDVAGHTPLHYAAEQGYAHCCETLIKLGAPAVPKAEDLKTPLHLAAEFGRLATVTKLLACTEGNGILSERDCQGRTPLHLAAKNGHLKVVQLLMSKGCPMVRDLAGTLPLHLACEEDRIDIVMALITAHPRVLNTADKDGNTPLHVAAAHNAARSVSYLLASDAQSVNNNEKLSAFDLAFMHRHREVAEAIIESGRWKELMRQPSSLYVWPAYGLVQVFPDVMLKVLDKCQTKSPGHPTAKEYHVKYNYRVLQPDLDPETDLSKAGRFEPLPVLKQMAKWKRVDLLCHPLCTSYLEAKWYRYGLPFHVVALALYIVFLTMLTYLVLAGIQFDLRPNMCQVSIARIKQFQPSLLDNNVTRVGPVDLSTPQGYLGNMDKTLLGFIISSSILHLLEMGFQLRRQGLKFFTNLMALFEVTLYISTMLFVIGFYDEANYYMSWESQWLVGAVAIFFAWVNFFFRLRRYGAVGMHVLILLRCMKMLVEAMVVLFLVVVTFAITFVTLNPQKILPDDPLFYTKDHSGDNTLDIYYTSTSTWQAAILRVSDIMIGDADVIDNFVDPILDGIMIFPTMTYLLGLLSMGVVTILLQSLIIGLTVGKIRELRETVTLRRKTMEVELHAEIEMNVPKRIMESWDIGPDQTVYPNKIRSKLIQDIVDYFAGSDKKEAYYSKDEGHEHPHQQAKHGLNEECLAQELFAKADQQYELLRNVANQMNLQLDGIKSPEPEGPQRTRRKISNNTRYVSTSSNH